MRRPPFALIALVIAVVGCFWTCDRPGCESTWRDFTAFVATVVQGKTDSALGQRVLGDIGMVAQISFNRTAKALHLPVDPMGMSDKDHAVVLIKGDVEEGTGFLVRMPDGPAVITNLHVLAGNSHFRILTDDNVELKVLSIRGASDRDLAFIAIQDDPHLTHYLELEQNVSDVLHTGDDLITPGDSEGGEVTLDTPGKVVGMGPQRIEISNPVFHGNSGGPVIDQGSGKVAGVVTFVLNVNPSDFGDRASLANPDSAITSSVRYFALRVDTVPQWDTFDLVRINQQSNYLQEFHENTVCLDSYLNGLQYERSHATAKGAPNSIYYLRSPDLRGLTDPASIRAFVQQTGNRAVFQTDLIECQHFAAQDMKDIANPQNFYAFEWTRAQGEIAYRMALMTELRMR